MLEVDHCTWYIEANTTFHAPFVNSIALCCVNGLIFILSLLANGSVVYRYYQTRNQQPVSNTLIFLMASFDLAQSAIGEPLYILQCILDLIGAPNCTLINIIHTAVCIFLGFSFFMSTYLLTSERFFAILYPIHHRVYMRKKVLVYLSLTLFACWATFFSIVHHFRSLDFLLIYLYTAIVAFGLIYTLWVYVKIFRVSRRSSRKIALSSSGALKMEDLIKDDRKLPSGVEGRAQEVAIRKEDSVLNSGMNDELSEGTNSTEYNFEGTTHPNESTSATTRCQKILNKTQSASQTFILTSKEKKTIFRMLSIVGVLCITSIPILANFAYIAVKRFPDSILVIYFYPWAITITFSPAVINPYIYCYKNEHFMMRKPAPRNSLSRSLTASTSTAFRAEHVNRTETL